jgi:FkbM family methyltransferase
MTTPILFLVFNRPDTTKVVFERIREIKPRYLFVAADGPRQNKEGEFERCKLVRQVILDGIDWECDVKMLFREENLGCGIAVSSAITWFFEHVEEGIILEDDCLPDLSFFIYCTIMLERYRFNKRVLTVSGNNFQGNVTRGDGSYYFSKYPHIWGWASWRRAWKCYDFKLAGWSAFVKKGLLNSCNGNQEEAICWQNIARSLTKMVIDTWDYQLLLSGLMHDGIHVIPNVNLVSNIGFGEDATHTKGIHHAFSRMSVRPYVLPDVIPGNVQPDHEADNYTLRRIFLPIGETMRPDSADSKKYFFSLLKKFIPYSLKDRVVKYLLDKYTVLPQITYPEFPELVGVPRFERQSITLFGKPFTLTDSESFLLIYKELFKDEIYQFTTVNEAPYIIDVGANIGLSVLYFKFNHPNARVVAFEPDPITFEVLSQNITTFGMNDVLLMNKAAWSSESKLRFFSGGAGGTRLALDGDLEHVIDVESVRLRQYLNRKVDLLKINIEGTETKVLDDCKDLLINVNRLFVAYHSFSKQEQQLGYLLSLIKESGFRYYILQADIRKGFPLNGFFSNPSMDNQLNIFAYRTPKTE